MVVQVQVLSVDSAEMAPCLLLTTETQRFLFNVGDGTQRMCMEHHVRLAKLKHVFLTELRAHTVGGLPGMVLTVSDTGKDALHVYGPPGTQRYLTATRHFLHRPNFGLQGYDLQPHVPATQPSATECPSASRTTATAPQACYSDDEVLVYAVVTGRAKAGVKRKLHESSALSPTASASAAASTSASSASTATATEPSAPANDCVSYVLETQPQRGKFLIERAIALGVPKGRLFGQLHQGNDVTLADGRVVRSVDCVSPTLPASGCAILACPSIEYVDELVKHAVGFERYQAPVGAQPAVQLAALYHLAPPDVLEHPKYVEWVQRFGASVEHVVLRHGACPQKTVYRASALLQAQLQSVFPRAFPPVDHELRDAAAPLGRSLTLPFAPHKPVVVGESMLKYFITPAARRGFDASACWRPVDLDNVRATTAPVLERLERERAVAAASGADTDNGNAARDGSASEDVKAATTAVPLPIPGRITFLGTGCAIPSKYRNVTGMYLELEKPSAASESSPSPVLPSAGAAAAGVDWDGMMLDCGEGSYGQLVRYANGDKRRVADLVSKLKCIWISHNHADHHLGAVRMLSERAPDLEPLVIIGPTPVEFWLNEYAEIDPTIAGKYRFVDNYCFDALDARFEEAVAVSKPTRAWLLDALRITAFECVRVKHAFRSYALVATFAGGSKVAFSGDCRPSTEFADKAAGALLMIHEATFEDAMGDEATSKDHCTTTEAVAVGRRARAAHVILTHFSQRYPKMPVLEPDSGDVLSAFDLLSLRFDELHQPALMDVCAELMGDDDDADGSGGVDGS